VTAKTRPFAALPPETATALRPVLSGLADETIAAIAVEVPDYARAMEGAFGAAVRRGVEIAFERFLSLIEDPQAAAGSRAHTIYMDLGRGEFHAGRSLDALLGAYRVGARVTSADGSATMSTKRFSAISTPRRTTWPNSPSIARA